MKRKLLFLAFILISAFANAQFPLLQYLGSDSTMVRSRGGLQGRIAPIPFTDTAAANLSRISQYPGALIYTSGVDKYWYRNATVTGWIEFTSSGGSGGSGIVSLGTSAYGLTIQNDSTYKADTIQLSTRLWRQKGIDSVQGNVTSGLALKLNLSDTASMLTNYVRRQELKDTAAAIRSAIGGGGSFTTDSLKYNSNTSTLTLYQTGASDLAAYINSSYLLFDSTYSPLGGAVNDSTAKVKSLEITVNNEPSQETITDSTLRVNIPVFDAEISGVVPPSTGTTTDFLRADGTWAEPAGGGGSSGDTITYSHNPSDWLVSQPHRSLPYFRTSGIAGDPADSYYESSMYTPAPIKITSGTNKGKFFAVAKGDFSRKLFGWISTDNCITWDTTGVVLEKSATGWDKSGVSMPHLIYDSATNIIHMWYMGYSDSLYPSVFGVGYATASGNSPTVFTKQGEVLSGQNFATQIGMPHKPGYLKVSSVVKGRETGKFYFHGSYWIGNGTTWVDSTIRLWQGVSATINGSIDSAQQILAPTGTNTLLENPTTYYGNDSAYWMIYTNGYTDLNGGIDSVQYLQTARSVSLKNPVWVKQPGIVFYPTKDSTWQGKRVYNGQLLKNGYGYYDRPISIRYDSTGRDTDGYEESHWLLFYSASYPNSYHDQGSILRILPQKKRENTYAIGFNGNFPNVIQKDGSAFFNIPQADTIRKSGYMDWRDYRDLNRQVETGIADRFAYYDSAKKSVRYLPTMSVTVGNYPTFTFGASGYNAANVYFRNGVGTTGMISEDAGMNYYASSTYMSHIWRDKVSGGIVLGRVWSSSGSPFAYFPGKTVFGSNVQATSHLQTDKTFAGIMSAAKTSAYTIADDYSIPCNATSAAFTVTLPQAIGCPGRIYIIKKIDSSGNAVTVQGSGSEPIDASNTYALASQWKYVVVQSTGSATTGWYIIGGN